MENLENLENWTDEDLIQVYDLQEKYTEKIVDFVRHADENEVYKFLQTIPELHSYIYLRTGKARIRLEKYLKKNINGILQKRVLKL